MLCFESQFLKSYFYARGNYCKLGNLTRQSEFSSFEKVRESRVSKDFLKFINLISIDFRITNTLLQTFLQTDMIHVFYDQFIVSMVKFGKCFAGFKIPIAFLYGIGGYEFVTASEIANMRRCSGKAKK